MIATAATTAFMADSGMSGMAFSAPEVGRFRKAR